jgi:hypothetical protein
MYSETIQSIKITPPSVLCNELFSVYLFILFCGETREIEKQRFSASCPCLFLDHVYLQFFVISVVPHAAVAAAAAESDVCVATESSSRKTNVVAGHNQMV